MDTKNNKIHRIFLGLGVVFLLAGLTSFWSAPSTQAACTSGFFCNGSERWYRFSSCNERFRQNCPYGCSGAGVCNSAPVCTPNCSGDQCGQSNGCGGSCGTGDSNSCGKCGNAACCTDNGTRTCDAATPACGQTTYGSYFDNCGTNRGPCSKTGPACTCSVISVCSDSNTVYRRNSDCSTNYQACSYGCSNGSCNTCTPVSGACGSNAAVLDSGSAYYAGSFCAAGSASPANPAFPAIGGSTAWNCNGNACGSSTSCTAYRRVPTASVSVSPLSVAPGGTVTFSWNTVTNATQYFIAFRRNGNWDQNWTYAGGGSTSSYNFSTSGLSGDVAGQILPCSATVCGYASNQATATIVQAPTADIKANGSDGPISISYNTAANIFWSSSNTSSCSVSPGSFSSTTSMPAPGQTTGALATSQTYTLSCNGTGGSASNQVTVNVAAPTVSVSSLSASPSSGTVPLNGVDFIINVGGNAVGDTQYQIDCANNGGYEFDRVISASPPYTAVDACDYASGGNHRANVVVRRGGQTDNRTVSVSVSYPPVTADIKAAIGQSTPADTLNVPVGTVYTLSWTATGATSCRTGTGGSWSQPNQSLALASGAGSTNRTMGSSTETYPITCSNQDNNGTDTITVYPIPVAPANLRITSATPYIKGNTIAFAWDPSPAASYYVVTYVLNGTPGVSVQPSPGYATAISYTNTSGLNSLGASVVACRGSGVCSSPTAILTANLINPTPANQNPASINTTSGGTSGYSGSLGSTTDVQYVRVPVNTSDQVYKLQTSGSITPTIAIVDANGNNIAPTSGSDIQISGNIATFKVPANATYYVKFTGASGSFTYGFQRFRNFPYYQGQ